MSGYAVLIGINEFEKYPAANLRYCDRDAEHLAQVLRSSSHLLHNFTRIEVVTNKKATRNHIIDTIDDCFSSAGAGDQIWLFIASHGYRRNTSNYIITHDTRAGSDPAKDGTCLQLEDIRRLLAESCASEKLVLLDCCHASSADFFQRRTAGEESFSPRAVKQTFSPHAFVFLNACMEGEVAHESEDVEHGVWTHYLIRGLQGTDGVWDSNGLLTVQTLHDYLHTHVSEYVRNKLGKHQHPDCELKAGLAHIILGRKPGDSNQKPATPKAKGTLKRVSDTVLLQQSKKLIAHVETEIIPLLQELSQQGTLEALNKIIAQWRLLESQEVRSPVAVLGHMGCGKTTLLNAICGEQVGFAGGGGARSAVSLVVKHKEQPYTVKATYLPLDELQHALALEVSESTDVLDLLSSSEDIELSPIQMATLESLLLDPQKATKSAIVLEDLQPRFRDLVRAGAASHSFGSAEVDKLLACVAEHADSSGPYWRITKEVEVAGPFPGLQSGIEIMDLPGLGDMDEMRLLRVRQALERVHQVIVVTDARGIDREARTALIDTGLVASVLMSPHIDQITFVGTKIDHGRVSPADQSKLLIPADYTPAQAVRAQFDQWVANVRMQWERILHTQVAKAKGAAHKDVSVVMAKTQFIPTSPEAYLCLSGLQRDPTGAYAKAFDAQSRKQAAEVTGISTVQRALGQLLDARKDLRREKLQKTYAHICRFIHDSCDPLLTTLTSTVAMSKNETAQLEHCLHTLLKIASHKDVCCTFDRPVLNGNGERLQKARELVAEGWKGMNNANMQLVLTTHYGSVNYMVLTATMRRRGIYAAGDKAKTRVNIPERIGQNVRTQLMGFVNKELLPTFEDDLRKVVASAVTEFKTRANAVIDSHKHMADSIRLFCLECGTFIAQYEEDASLEVDNAAAAINALKVAASDLADESIGEGFESLMNVALDKGKGRGARQIMLEQFAQMSEQMRPDICKRTAHRFTERILNEMTRICYDLDTRLMSLRRLVVDRMGEAKTRLSTKMDVKDKERLAKSLSGILERVPKDE